MSYNLSFYRIEKNELYPALEYHDIDDIYLDEFKCQHIDTQFNILEEIKDELPYFYNTNCILSKENIEKIISYLDSYEIYNEEKEKDIFLIRNVLRNWKNDLNNYFIIITEDS